MQNFEYVIPKIEGNRFIFRPMGTVNLFSKYHKQFEDQQFLLDRSVLEVANLIKYQPIMYLVLKMIYYNLSLTLYRLATSSTYR